MNPQLWAFLTRLFASRAMLPVRGPGGRFISGGARAMGPGTAAGTLGVGAAGMADRVREKLYGPTLSPDQAEALERQQRFANWESPENRHQPSEPVVIAASPEVREESPVVIRRDPVVSRAQRVIDVPLPPRREEPRRVYIEPEYQSNGRVVYDGDRVNWGDADSPSDFARADKADLALRGYARGGSTDGNYEHALRLLAAHLMRG